MVKFGKQLEAQLVQEWRSAYVDYKLLKKDIAAVKTQKVAPPPVRDKWHDIPITPATPLVSGPFGSSSSPKRPAGRKLNRQITRGMSRVQDTFTGTFNSFVSVTGQAADSLRSRPISRKMRKKHDIIKVKTIELTEVGQYEVYSSELSDAFSGTESSSRIFFARLDAEFNKVNHFYRKKEEEFIEHYESLQNQVEALEGIRITLKEGFQQHHDEPNAGNRPNTIAEEVDVATKRQTACQSSRVPGNKSLPPLDVSRAGSDQEFPAVSMDKDGDDYLKARGATTARPAHREADSPTATVEMADLGSTKDNGDSSSRGGGGGSEIGDSSKPNMRLKLPLATPRTTIKTLTQSLWEELQIPGGHSKQSSSNGEEAQFAVTKRNVNVAEKMLRTAFVEFYRGLTILKRYRSLNMVALAKIVKKFDKASGYRTFPIYIKTVESSYFNTSDKAIILLEKVETLYAKTFVKDNLSKARVHLRPAEKKSSHTVTFFLGLFTGGSLALVAVFATFLNSMLDTYVAPYHENSSAPAQQFPENIYLKTVFPLFGLSALIIIHLLMYGFNVFYWRKWRINYAFMFDLKQGTELRHREILLTASILMTILVAAMVGHLALHTVSDSPYVDFIPLNVFMLLVVLLFFPLNVFYRSSRLFVLTCFIHLALSPLYKVVLQDFFLGDQLTSQVPMLRNLQYLLCYYPGSFFKTSNSDGCLMNETYKGFVYLVSLLPYWWRFLQCIRRWVEENSRHQLLNGGKYMSAMVAVGLRIQYTRDSNIVWFVLFILASIFATAFQIYWDLFVDWGLLQKNSKNKWLRDNLIMPRAKYWYFLSMISNVILRLAWLQSITRFRFGQMDFQVADFTYAALEVIRRGIWNFYRLENEHLNNVGKYRATKTVPLPFENPMSEDY